MPEHASFTTEEAAASKVRREGQHEFRWKESRCERRKEGDGKDY